MGFFIFTVFFALESLIFHWVLYSYLIHAFYHEFMETAGNHEFPLEVNESPACIVFTCLQSLHALADIQIDNCGTLIPQICRHFCFTVQMDNDLKHTAKITQGFLK